MATNYWKIKKGLALDPQSGTTVSVEGDVAFRDDNKQLEVHNGTTAENITTNSNTQTLTNKTLSGSTATSLVSGSGTLTINTTGTITVPNGTDTLVGRATTDTLTNKTLIAPIISTISNTGTLTLPTSTDTLVGRTTTDTLTNKTISRATNTLSGYTANAVLIADGSGNATSEATLAVSRGGTNIASYTAGDILYASGTTTLAKLPVGTDTQVLTLSGTTPSWATASAANSSSILQNLGLSVTASAGTMTIALKQSDGSTDPASGAGAVKIGFRDATSTNGDYVIRSITAANSMTLAGATTLGGTSAVAYTVYVYAFDNAGTVTLGASLNTYDEGSVQSSSTTTTSNQVIYQASALSNKAVRLVGKFVATNTANSWASPTEASLLPFQTPALVAARYSQKTGESFSTSTDLRINYETKDFDTHGMGTTGVGAFKITAPIAGTYSIKASVTTAVNNGTGNGDIKIYKNVGATQIAFIRNAREVVSNSAFSLQVTTLQKLVAGDFVYGVFNTNTGTYNTDTDATGSETTFELYRVGN